MRMIGPNCMGIMNLDPEVRLNATFGPQVATARPRCVLLSERGLGAGGDRVCRGLGLGLSSFVSVGNKADVSRNDLLHHWEDDPDTEVVLLYLESFGNPRRFAQITRRIGQAEALIAVKSGRRAGGRATSSHTGRCSRRLAPTVDAMFRPTGVIRADTLDDMFDLAAPLAESAPAGRPAGRASSPTRVDSASCAGMRARRGAPGRSSAGTLPLRALAHFCPAPRSSTPWTSSHRLGRRITVRRSGGVRAGELDSLLVIFMPSGSPNRSE